MEPLNTSQRSLVNVAGNCDVSSWREWSKKSPSKAAAVLARGAYFQYVSTAKGRERRWWVFSTFPKLNGERISSDENVEGNLSHHFQKNHDCDLSRIGRQIQTFRESRKRRNNNWEGVTRVNTVFSSRRDTYRTRLRYVKRAKKMIIILTGAFHRVSYKQSCDRRYVSSLRQSALNAWYLRHSRYAVNRATGVRGALRNRFRNGNTCACTGVVRCWLMTGSKRFPHMTHRYARIQSSPMPPFTSRQSSTTISPLHLVQFITLLLLKASCSRCCH